MISATQLLAATVLIVAGATRADPTPATPPTDPRIRDTPYGSSTVYQLAGRVGYQIDIEFEPGERYVGLAAGDVNGISFEAQDNHVFLKPKAAHVATNLTILTDRRHYYFDYAVPPRTSSLAPITDTLYALRFRYPQAVARAVNEKLSANHVNADLAAEVQPLNLRYSYCGAPTLKPSATFDNGVRTHFSFPSGAELPAVYVQNEDGVESLVNFTVNSDGLTIQRIARRFVLRRGTLKGCVVNEAFNGAGERVTTGTVSPNVERDIPQSRP